MKLLVLLISYAMVLLIDELYFSIPNHAYYLLSACSSFVLFFLCIRSKDRLINGYAYIQLIALVIYVQMITPSGFYAVDFFMYGSVINYANVILLYEVLMLVFGVMDVYNAMHRYNYGNYMHSYRSE